MIQQHNARVINLIKDEHGVLEDMKLDNNSIKIYSEVIVSRYRQEFTLYNNNQTAIELAG